MACRQRHELFAAAVEERIGTDDECVGMLLDKSIKGGLEFALGAGFQDIKLHALRPRRFLHGFDVARDIRIVRVHQQGDQPGLGNQLGKQLEPLGRQLAAEDAEAREIGRASCRERV